MKQSANSLTLAHLGCFIAGSCVVFALLRASTTLAVAACPLLLGPLVAYAVATRADAIVTGLFSAIFWTLFALMMFAAVFANFTIEEFSGLRAVVVAYLSSILGGYVGGSLSLHASE